MFESHSLRHIFTRINAGDYQRFVDGVLERGLASQVSGG
jgi:hypothetical protein